MLRSSWTNQHEAKEGFQGNHTEMEREKASVREKENSNIELVTFFKQRISKGFVSFTCEGSN